MRPRPPTPWRRLGDAGPAAATLGSRTAAELYGGSELIADVGVHRTTPRFVWLVPAAEAAEPDGAAKTAIVFWGAGDERPPGWLVDVLGELSSRG